MARRCHRGLIIGGGRILDIDGIVGGMVTVTVVDVEDGGVCSSSSSLALARE
jgi:hypothetical protein